MDLITMLTTGRAGIAIIAATSAAVVSYTTYLKKKKKENFEIEQLMKSVTLGASVGFLSSYLYLPADIIVSSPFYAGLAVTAENVIKYLFRRFKK